jgi:AP-1 complex subunit beta-1
MHDISPTSTKENGLFGLLQDLLTDSNPTVISNAVAALTDIADSPTFPIPFILTPYTVTKLLTALNECTEYSYLHTYSYLKVGPDLYPKEYKRVHP